MHGDSGARGRQASDEELAHQLKLDSEKQDAEARKLRIRANKDYDQAQEVSRNVGILTEKVRRFWYGRPWFHQTCNADVDGILLLARTEQSELSPIYAGNSGGQEELPQRKSFRKKFSHD